MCPSAIATPDGPQPTTTGEHFKGKKVALFAVPGAYTPTCSARHLPGYVDKAGEFTAKGVDEIACTSVNDAFVMGAWNQAQGSEDIVMLADGNGDFAEALGLTMDGSEVRHGQAQPALLDGRQRRRGRATERRSAGRILGFQRRNHARPAVTPDFATRGGTDMAPPRVTTSHNLCEE